MGQITIGGVEFKSRVAYETTVLTGIERLYTTGFFTENIWEIDPDTLLSISVVSAPSTSPFGIGGILDRLYHVDGGTNLVYELDPDTKLQTSSATAPFTAPNGIGGTNNKLYVAKSLDIYELDPDTKLQIQLYNNGEFLFGIGGISNRLYSSIGGSEDELHELDTTTLLSINSVATPSTDISDIGGTNNRLYTTDTTSDLNYELDLDTLLPINSVATQEAFIRGIGGIKSTSSTTLTIIPLIDGQTAFDKIEFASNDYET
jgi:hypothetical protein